MATFAGWIGDKALSIGGKAASFEDWTNGKVHSVENSIVEFRHTAFPKFVESYKRKQRLLTRYTKAIICRVFFALHGCVTIWRVFDVCEKKAAIYALCVPIIVLLFEVPSTVRFTKKGEWKWFCPSVFLYLASVIPAIWLLHLDLYHDREKWANKLGLDACDIMLPGNETGLPTIRGVSIPLELPAEDWVSTLQQVMFVILVGGRWLLPKGHLSREQLSQLLMFYLGIAADSLEFSIETLSLETVNCDLKLIYAVLAIWTWSMMQFTFVRSSVTGGSDMSVYDKELDVSKRSHGYAVVKRCCESEIWSLLMTVLLQDGPFLTMRLILMIRFQVFNNLMLFFVIKNILVVCIQLYRVVILIFPGSVRHGEQRLDEAHVANENCPKECQCYCHNEHGRFVNQMSLENHQDNNLVDVENGKSDFSSEFRDQVKASVQTTLKVIDKDKDLEVLESVKIGTESEQSTGDDLHHLHGEHQNNAEDIEDDETVELGL